MRATLALNGLIPLNEQEKDYYQDYYALLLCSVKKLFLEISQN